MSSESHSPIYYVKIWALLLVLLIISIIGPEFGIRWVTMVTAFGIAFVKAYIVGAYFMHLKSEKRIITYMLLGMVALLLVFVAGTMVDIMSSKGSGWERLRLDKTIPADDHHDDEPH